MLVHRRSGHSISSGDEFGDSGGKVGSARDDVRGCEYGGGVEGLCGGLEVVVLAGLCNPSRILFVLSCL